MIQGGKIMAKEITDSTFETEVIKSELPVLVDFWAPWCPPCRMLAPIVEAIGKKYEGKLKVLKLNTDENQATASEYQITGIPTLLVFKNGQLIDRIVGAMPQDALEKKLGAHI
jgi:thioredoxin 1